MVVVAGGWQRLKVAEGIKLHRNVGEGGDGEREGRGAACEGERKRKLLKKWRRDHKEALRKGLITIHDVEMAAAHDFQEDGLKVPTKLSTKKPLKLKKLKRRDKGKRKSIKPSAAQVPADAMVDGSDLNDRDKIVKGGSVCYKNFI